MAFALRCRQNFLFVDHDMYMHYRGGGVGHYQVPIPPEDEDCVQDDPHEDDQDQEIQPLVTPPPTPKPEEQEFSDRISLPDGRPGSSLSQNSEKSLESNGSGSASGTGSDDGFEPDLGPEDSLGDVEEVEEGYTVM
ncbi:hypothetical protein K438DRAFT_1748996 [Mycena galopus ATCC 62051]|nr:hypothetical protein K438DRAFT_1748996 [Mycena galopus ATCC 62051]